MDKYYDKYYTPLKYHKFLKYAGLPLSCFVTVLRLFSTVLQNDTMQNDLYTVDVLALFVSVIVLGVTLYGFYTWKPCGFYGVLANQGIGVLYSIYAVVVYSALAPDMVISGVGDLLGKSTVAVLVAVYYCKRRPLFFPEMQEAYMAKMFAEPAAVPVVSAEDRSQGDPTRCRVCGEKLNMGRDACMKCGTAIPGRAVPQDPGVQKTGCCRKCGHPLTADSNFCRHCGDRVL